MFEQLTIGEMKKAINSIDNVYDDITLHALCRIDDNDSCTVNAVPTHIHVDDSVVGEPFVCISATIDTIEIDKSKLYYEESGDIIYATYAQQCAKQRVVELAKIINKASESERKEIMKLVDEELNKL